MSETTNRYSNGKIYTIRSNQTEKYTSEARAYLFVRDFMNTKELIDFG